MIPSRSNPTKHIPFAMVTAIIGGNLKNPYSGIPLNFVLSRQVIPNVLGVVVASINSNCPNTSKYDICKTGKVQILSIYMEFGLSFSMAKYFEFLRI